MNLYKYKFTYASIIIVVSILFIMPILLKGYLKNLKVSQQYEMKKDVEKNTEEEVSIHTIIEEVDKKEKLFLEGININEEGKEVILSSRQDIFKINELLQELSTFKKIKAINEITYRDEIWTIKLLVP